MIFPDNILTEEKAIEYNIVLQYREKLSMLDREFFLGFIKIHMLYHASKESIFGAEMTQELARHGYDISPGTLYPTLHRLEKEGYLKSSSKVVEGRVRKYYQATAEGKQVLEQSKKRIRELVTEVIEEKQTDWPVVRIIGESRV